MKAKLKVPSSSPDLASKLTKRSMSPKLLPSLIRPQTIYPDIVFLPPSKKITEIPKSIAISQSRHKMPSQQSCPEINPNTSIH